MRKKNSPRALKSSRTGRRLLAVVLVIVVVLCVAVIILPRRPGAHPGTPPAADVHSPAARPALPSPATDISRKVLNAADEAAERAERITARDIHARKRVPPHPWHLERLENIANETLEETARNLAHSDDRHLVDTSLADVSAGMSTQWYVLGATRLVRVRKLLEMGRTDPSRITPLLRELLLEAAEGFEEACRERDERFRKEGPQVRYASDPVEKWMNYRYRAIGATYVLAELNDYDALPVLAQSYRVHSLEPIRRAPIRPAMTLYAMHRLVSSFPEERLSAEAKRLRDEYLEAAKILPEPKTMTVTSWSAKYNETDPRIMIFDPQGRVLKGQPTMKISVWPHTFTDGTLMMWRFRKMDPRGQMLFEKIEAFIDAAFPQNNPPHATIRPLPPYT